MSIKRQKGDLLSIDEDEVQRRLDEVMRRSAHRVDPDAAPAKADDCGLYLVASQMRSGGTMLAALFDSHEACLTYPGELSVGFPSKHHWPRLETDVSPARAFLMLFDRRLVEWSEKGFLKIGKAQLRTKRKDESIPFRYDPRAHYETFERLFRRSASRRQILDSYLTALGKSWRDTTDRAVRRVVGHLPGNIERRKEIGQFLSDYPDTGLLVSVRDPRDWFVSARRHVTRKGAAKGMTAETARRYLLEAWQTAARNIIELHDSGRSRLLCVHFSDLVHDRSRVYADACGWMGVDPAKGKGVPTFANASLRPNTNFGPAETPADVEGRRRDLSADELEEIGEAARPFHAEMDRIVGALFRDER